VLQARRALQARRPGTPLVGVVWPHMPPVCLPSQHAPPPPPPALTDACPAIIYAQSMYGSSQLEMKRESIERKCFAAHPAKENGLEAFMRLPSLLVLLLLPECVRRGGQCCLFSLPVGVSQQEEEFTW